MTARLFSEISTSSVLESLAMSIRPLTAHSRFHTPSRSEPAERVAVPLSIIATARSQTSRRCITAVRTAGFSAAPSQYIAGRLRRNRSQSKSSTEQATCHVQSIDRGNQRTSKHGQYKGHAYAFLLLRPGLELGERYPTAIGGDQGFD